MSVSKGRNPSPKPAGPILTRDWTSRMRAMGAHTEVHEWSTDDIVQEEGRAFKKKVSRRVNVSE
jgi:hypothetical protein